MKQLLGSTLCSLLLGLAGCSWTSPSRVTVKNWSRSPVDATILANATGGNRAPDSIFVGCNSRGTAHRGLIRFDVSSIPADATIVSVALELSLLKTRSSGDPMKVCRLRESWDEDAVAADGSRESNNGGVTWALRSKEKGAWSTAGGHRAPEASATAIIDGAKRYSVTSAAMLADVKGWIQSPDSNHGWLLLGDESSAPTVKRFASRRNADSDARPALLIEYVQ